MSQSAIMAAVTAKNAANMRAAFVSDLIAVIPDDTDPQTWDPRELGVAGGAVWPAVAWDGQIWYRDPDDATSAHDGVSVIVTLDGSRYKTDALVMPEAVISATVAAPPGAPDFGDAYLVAAGATGAWAGHEDEIAIFTARGWRFRTKQIGALVFVRDEEGFWHVGDDDLWHTGTGSYAFADGVVHPRNLLIRDWNVENQTTNAPPADGPAGEQYVIGPTPTGTWAAQAKKLAYRPTLNGAFVILTPFNGEEIFDKATQIRYRFDGTSWQSTAGAIVESGAVFTADVNPGVTLTQVGTTLTYAGSATVAPKSTEWHTVDTLATFTITSRRAGQRLAFMWQASTLSYGNGVGAGAGGDAGDIWIGLWRDNEQNALDWCQLAAGTTAVLFNQRALFEVTTDDQAAHTYKIRLMSYRRGGDTRTPAAAVGGILTRRRFTYQMYS